MSQVIGINNIEQNNTSNIKNTTKTNITSTKFSSMLGETKTLDEIFQKAADKYDVPVELLKAVGKAESGFDAKAVSRSGAQGIMQLMPRTAEYLGVKDSFDAEQNIMGGAKYLKELLAKYDGNTKLALAAYNAGSNNVAKYGGIPPFKETQNYVVKVMNFMNEGVDTGNKTVAVAGTSKATKYIRPVSNEFEIIEMEDKYNELNALFSYDDFLKFLELFNEEKKDKEGEDESPNQLLKALNYNVPVLNLLNGGTKI
jgi:hypothetical protein